jgi:hypothetical protein
MTRPMRERDAHDRMFRQGHDVRQLERRPAPTGAVASYGEAYKSADQNISDTTFTKLTSWALWNTPFDTTITDFTNGLEIVTDLYCHVVAAVTWNTGTFTGGDEWYGTIAFTGTGGGADLFIDRIQSPVVEMANGTFDTHQLDLWWGGLVLCPAGTTLEVWVNQWSGATQSVADALLRVAALAPADPSFDPRP